MLLRLAILPLCSVCVMLGQTCYPSSAPAQGHLEGYAEKLGDLVITCNGGTAGVTVSASLFIAFSARITNRLDANGVPTGITLALNGAAGSTNPITFNSATLLSSGFRYTVPADPQTSVTFTLSGVRSGPGATGVTPQTISAAVTLVGLQFPLSGSALPLAVLTPSLTGTVLNTGLSCAGSPLPVSPAILDFPGFAASTLSSTLRVTESSITAFAAKQPGDDTGVRLIVRLTGYGTGVRVFVPDALVGSTGATPTSNSAFGNTAAGGTYTPGSAQLLLGRVDGANASGAGGNLVQTAPTVITTFSRMSEIPVTGGSAFAVYEVLDASAALRESVVIPVFLVYAQNNCAAASQTALSATMGPTSTVATGTATDPIPRFAAATLASDCQLANDCNAGYYPHLLVDQTSIAIAGSSLGPKQTAGLRVGNSGSAQLIFAATVAYPSGGASGWLSVSPTTGINNVALQLTADPAALQPGTYTATLNIDAGSAGTDSIPVTFTVGPQGITIQALVNAASFLTGGVAPGSYAALFGLNLGGTNVSVTFDGLPAVITFRNSTQINLLVPSTLAASQGASNVVLTADGKQSNTLRAGLQPNFPGIFTPGIVNEEGTVNSSTQPAALGSTVAVYVTGLTIPLTNQLTVNIGGASGLIPAFAGQQGTFPGLQQVNIQIPNSQPPGTLSLNMCIPGLTGLPICSNTVSLYAK